MQSMGSSPEKDVDSINQDMERSNSRHSIDQPISTDNVNPSDSPVVAKVTAVAREPERATAVEAGTPDVEEITGVASGSSMKHRRPAVKCLELLAVDDKGFFERLDNALISISEEERGILPSDLDVGPIVEMRSFNKKRKIDPKKDTPILPTPTQLVFKSSTKAEINLPEPVPILLHIDSDPTSSSGPEAPTHSDSLEILPQSLDLPPAILPLSTPSCESPSSLAFKAKTESPGLTPASSPISEPSFGTININLGSSPKSRSGPTTDSPCDPDVATPSPPKRSRSPASSEEGDGAATSSTTKRGRSSPEELEPLHNQTITDQQASSPIPTLEVLESVALSEVTVSANASTNSAHIIISTESLKEKDSSESTISSDIVLQRDSVHSTTISVPAEEVLSDPAPLSAPLSAPASTDKPKRSAGKSKKEVQVNSIASRIGSRRKIVHPAVMSAPAEAGPSSKAALSERSIIELDSDVDLESANPTEDTTNNIRRKGSAISESKATAKKVGKRTLTVEKNKPGLVRKVTFAVDLLHQTDDGDFVNSTSSQQPDPTASSGLNEQGKGLSDYEAEDEDKGKDLLEKDRPLLSSVAIYVIPLLMNATVFKVSRTRVIRLHGKWLGPKTKVVSVHQSVDEGWPSLDQDSTTHIVTALTSLDAVQKALKVDSINSNIAIVNPTWLSETIWHKAPQDVTKYQIRPSEKSIRKPQGESPPSSLESAPRAVASKSISVQKAKEKESGIDDSVKGGTSSRYDTRKSTQFAKFKGASDGQAVDFDTILQGIQEGSINDDDVSDVPQSDNETAIENKANHDTVSDRNPVKAGEQKEKNKEGVLLDIISSGKTEGKRRKKILYQCQSPHVAGQSKEPQYNKAILEQLKTLMDHYDKTKTKGSKEHFKVINYRKAITAIRALDYEITSEAQALAVPRVGKKIAQKMGECIALGRIKKLDHLNWDQERQKVEDLFRNVYGVGSEKATEWYNRGLRTLDDLREKVSDLTKNQVLGLRYYEDLLVRIPRSEVGAIGKVVERVAHELHPDIQCRVTGSYRRGKPDCGDIDIVIARPDIDQGDELMAIMEHVLQRLINTGFLVDHLSLPVWEDGMADRLKHFKYMGICKLQSTGNSAGSSRQGKGQESGQGEVSGIHRHIDILVVPWKHLGAVLIYFTGNDICNRSMRLLARNRGMRLSDKGLFVDVIRDRHKNRVNEGRWVAGRTEREVFEYLGIEYLEPHEREC